VPNAAHHDSRSLVVLIPVFDDWDAVALLLPQLDAALAGAGLDVSVLLVDDASVSEPTRALRSVALSTIRALHVLPLRRNLGHQRAIALGLAYVEAQLPCDEVVVMDGDGEDAPDDVRRMLDRSRELQGKQVVFAERTQRAEGLVFRAFYRGYRAVHRLVTGKAVYFGNFSVLPRALLRRVVVVSELWNHYAAAVMRSRIPYTALNTTRGTRLAGRSKMSFVSLVTHGLSAMSVHADLAGVRLLVANALTILSMGAGLSVVVALRLFTQLAIPGWASTIGMLLLVLMSQSAILSVVFVFMTLQGRTVHGFLPARDYVHYVDAAYRLLPAP
jgi:polyisoprenyl-phosphate glycosyltransferase